MVFVYYIHSLETIKDVFDCTIDVIVDLDDGYSYIISIVTHQYLVTLMGEKNYVGSGNPPIILREMTKESIEAAIQDFAEDEEGYWLKFYGAQLDIKTLDVLKDRYIARDRFFDECREKGKSIAIENYNLIDFDTG